MYLAEIYIARINVITMVSSNIEPNTLRCFGSESRFRDPQNIGMKPLYHCRICSITRMANIPVTSVLLSAHLNFSH